MFSLVTTTVFFYVTKGQNLCDGASECASTTLTGTQAQCYGYQGCYSADIDTTTTYCYGYQACENADIDSSGTAYCNGLNACQSASVTANSVVCNGDESCESATIDSDTTLLCDGEYSCNQAKGNVDTDLSCNGYFSCYGANLTLDAGSASILYVEGNRGGASATISGANSKTGQITLRSYGLYSSSQSTTRSGESNTLYALFGGYLSGYQANVYCESGSTCYVRCYGYGCLNTVLYCDSSATCTITCENEPSSTYCATQSTSMENMNKHDKLLSIEELSKLEFDDIDVDELAHHEALTKDIPQIVQDKVEAMAFKAKKIGRKEDKESRTGSQSSYKNLLKNDHFWKGVAVIGFAFGALSFSIMCCQNKKYKDYTRI